MIETIFLVAAPLPWLLANVNADDFYYYLVLAQNSAAGIGPSFDGQELTNGFHPLYLILITPLAKLTLGEPVLFAKSSLVLLLVFHNATAIVLAIGFQQRGRPDLGVLAACLWLCNPWALSIALHGVEAPIATFVGALIIFGMLAYRQRHCPSALSAIGLGALLGLSIWARTDGLLWLGAILLAETIRAWLRPQDRLRYFGHVALIGTVAFVLIAPWWWWNWVNFGMITQVSGQAIHLGTHGFDWLNELEQSWGNINIVARIYLSRVLLFAALPLLIVVVGLWQRRYQPAWGGRLKPLRLIVQLDFAWLSVLALIAWYVGWQWNAQSWYMLSTVLVVTIGAGLAWEQLSLSQRQIDVRPAIGIAVFVGVLFALAGGLILGFGYPRQIRGYYLAQWLNQHTEPQSVIGAWNSGIISFFTDRQVVNLDGVVNNGLYDYFIARQSNAPEVLLDYLRHRGISYITDYEYFHLDKFKEKVDLQLVHESPEYQFRIYRLKQTAGQTVQHIE